MISLENINNKRQPKSLSEKRRVKKFFNLNAFYFPDSKTIEVHVEEFIFFYKIAGDTLKITGQAQNRRVMDSGINIPDKIKSEARKKAYIVLKIIKKEENNIQLDLFQ